MTNQGWNAFEISLSSDLLWMQWDELRAQWEKSPIQCHGESQDKKFCIYYALSMYMLIHKMLFIYIYMFSIFLCFTSKELITKKLIMVYIIIHQTYCTYTNLGNSQTMLWINMNTETCKQLISVWSINNKLYFGKIITIAQN